MAKYKIIFHYSSGASEEEDELYDTESEARSEAEYMCSCCEEGADVLYMSRPDDYPLEDAVTATYEIIEVDD